MAKLKISSPFPVTFTPGLAGRQRHWKRHQCWRGLDTQLPVAVATSEEDLLVDSTGDFYDITV